MFHIPYFKYVDAQPYKTVIFNIFNDIPYYGVDAR